MAIVDDPINNYKLHMIDGDASRLLRVTIECIDYYKYIYQTIQNLCYNCFIIVILKVEKNMYDTKQYFWFREI